MKDDEFEFPNGNFLRTQGTFYQNEKQSPSKKKPHINQQLDSQLQGTAALKAYRSQRVAKAFN